MISLPPMLDVKLLCSLQCALLLGACRVPSDAASQPIDSAGVDVAAPARTKDLGITIASLESGELDQSLFSGDDPRGKDTIEPVWVQVDAGPNSSTGSQYFCPYRVDCSQPVTLEIELREARRTVGFWVRSLAFEPGHDQGFVVVIDLEDVARTALVQVTGTQWTLVADEPVPDCGTFKGQAASTRTEFAALFHSGWRNHCGYTVQLPQLKRTVLDCWSWNGRLTSEVAASRLGTQSGPSVVSNSNDASGGFGELFEKPLKEWPRPVWVLYVRSREAP